MRAQSIWDTPLPTEQKGTEGSIFGEEKKTTKQEEAETRRQHENLKRIGWWSGKFGLITLILVARGAKEVGAWVDKKATSFNETYEKWRPKKKSLRKDVEKAMGIRLTAKKKSTKKVAKQ